MMRITHNFLVLAALTTASLNVVAAQKRFKEDDYMRDGGDWNLLEEWFIDDKRWHKDGKRDLAKTKDARSEGTFWNVRKAKGFVNQPSPLMAPDPETREDLKRCGIVFYYPAFWRPMNANRPPIQQNMNKIPDGKTREAFEKPLAIAPWCDPEPKGDDWGNKDKKIVFHNYFWETDLTLDDMYLTLSYGLDHHPEAASIDDQPDTLPFKSHKEVKIWYATASGVSDLPDIFHERADMDYIYGLLEQYANSVQDGKVPNPWKYGIGEFYVALRILDPVSDTKQCRGAPIDSREWSKWTDLDEFWGYVRDTGVRLPEPTKGYSDCDDPDDLSMCAEKAPPASAFE